VRVNENGVSPFWRQPVSGLIFHPASSRSFPAAARSNGMIFTSGLNIQEEGWKMP
jgi:hypothetical protein